MAQTQVALRADPSGSTSVVGSDLLPSQPANDRDGRMPSGRSRATSGLDTEALDRLIARIASGIATPEDVADLPDGVLGYLDAVLALYDAGILDEDWDVRVDGGMLVLQIDPPNSPRT